MKPETAIRRACAGIGLIIDGAIRHIESDYGPEENPNRSAYVEELFDAVTRELDSWEVGEQKARQDLAMDLRMLLGATSSEQDTYRDELLALTSLSPEQVRNFVAFLLVRHNLLP